MKKKNSKKMGIKIKTNKDNNIFFFQNKDDDEFKYILLEDENNLLSEKENTTDFKYRDKHGNKTITLSRKKNISTYENKYTIDKTNLINTKLLEKYCGTSKVNTNLIIQLIHNNEDIKKILSVYVNNVIFTTSSLSGSIEKEPISKIRDDWRSDKKFIYAGSKKYLDKIHNEFEKQDLDIIIDTIRTRNFTYGLAETRKETIFSYLQAISILRNKIAHFNTADKQKPNYKTLKDELNIYIDKKGKEFIKSNALNIDLIKKLYNSNNTNEEIKNYYLYVLNEKDKNIGISIKKLMEIGRLLFPATLDEEQTKKYNVLLKYHLYNYLTSNKDIISRYVEILRESDFDEKDEIYTEIVKTIGEKEFNRVKDICSEIDFRTYKNNIDDITAKNILNNINNSIKWNDLTIEIYALTKFLTIKEVNNLISTIINKLQSMQDILEIANNLDINLDTLKTNKLMMCDLNSIEQILEQLRIVNSSKRFISIKHSKYNFDYLEEGLSLFKSIKYSKDDLRSLLDEKNPNYKRGKIKYPIKNFIRNNVIKSKEFNYISRYINFSYLTTENRYYISNILYNNPNLVKFLLNSFSDTELEKLREDKVDEKVISSITLDSIIENLEKGNMEYSNAVKPYLKCLYFLLKNMVNINSYYFIAFAFYVRDSYLIDQAFDGKTCNLAVTNKLFSNIKNDISQRNITIKNANEILSNDSRIFQNYRNNIEHLAIIKILTKTKFPEDFEYKNYFKIYHYCMQNNLLQTYKRFENNIEYLNNSINDIANYHKYSKNLLYVLNSTFMYNYARYKDLSDENIFLRKYEIEK